jgi:hypothetical protein
MRRFSNFARNLDQGGPKFDMKYFITRSTILRVYRESLQLANKVEDPSMRESMKEMMKHEFRPFKMAREQKKMLKQEAVDYNLAKIRQRIN